MIEELWRRVSRGWDVGSIPDSGTVAKFWYEHPREASRSGPPYPRTHVPTGGAVDGIKFGREQSNDECTEARFLLNHLVGADEQVGRYIWLDAHDHSEL